MAGVVLEEDSGVAEGGGNGGLAKGTGLEGQKG